MKQFILSSLAIMLSAITFSQGTSWERASNCGCYFQTSPGASFTWSGGTSNGYCNGYGTIQWYDGYSRSGKYVGNLMNGKADGYATQYRSNGNILYQGYWKNDMRHGRGTSYNSDGSVLYKGIFAYDKIKNLSTLESIAGQVASYIVQRIFFGGTNVSYTIKRAVFNDDESLHEFWLYIYFNGNIVQTNEYYLTLKYNEDWAIPIDFYDYSDNCEDYLAAFAVSEIIRYFQNN